MNDIRILEVRIGTEVDAEWTFMGDIPLWLVDIPWHIFEEVRVIHKHSKVPIYYRTRMVSEDKAFELEEAYLEELKCEWHLS